MLYIYIIIYNIKQANSVIISAHTCAEMITELACIEQVKRYRQEIHFTLNKFKLI